RESSGMAISVTDEEILESMRELAQAEGIFACPEGAATWAALKHLKEQNAIKPQDKVVLFNTGAGLKYPELISPDIN
ncbi:MAG: pyridoxal-phosphate dependent enzyme, partial [bacterium]